MRSKEICQKIKNIEIKYKPTILVNNINFWPILRITIINLLYNHQLVKKNNQEARQEEIKLLLSLSTALHTKKNAGRTRKTHPVSADCGSQWAVTQTNCLEMNRRPISLL